MINVTRFLLVFFVFTITSCSKEEDWSNSDVQIPDFNYPQTVVFEQNLSAYNIFDGDYSNLTPSNDFHLLELSSILFTDYAKKQRLVKVPAGTSMSGLNSSSLDFPDGTILVKTFYYWIDERDTSLGKRVIESRLMIKQAEWWNVATYIWNEAQTDANLELNGANTSVEWITSSGQTRSTLYHVPNENECIACHQSNGSMIPLGTSLRNLNRMVERNGTELAQLNHLQSLGILANVAIDQVHSIVDYNDLSAPLASRGRAYLEMNCAHCHNPNAWDEAADRDLDFRYETAFSQTGINDRKYELLGQVAEGNMPFIGTTVIDEESIALLLQYVQSL